MPRNIEIKASVSSLAALMAKAVSVATSGPTVIHQDDTFLACDKGRLKLRAFPNGSGELIFYRRENVGGPKTSFYDIALTQNADQLRGTLALAYGVVGRVKKKRTLFLVGRTRVHIDEVQGLGDFMELEVVLDDDETETSGIQEAHELMSVLGIPGSALVDRAYVDLINESRA